MRRNEKESTMTPRRRIDCALRWVRLAATLTRPEDRAAVLAAARELVDSKSEQR